MKKIRILIADDHTLSGADCERWFKRTPDIAVVGELPTGKRQSSKSPGIKPDVAIMDITMPR